MDSRDLIFQADAIARKQGFTQAAWSDAAGMASGGQGVSKLLSRGDCRLSTLIALLKPIGCALTITGPEGKEFKEEVST